MAEFDEKLNALLSNPDSMAQIMRLAQSLSGDTEGGSGQESQQHHQQEHHQQEHHHQEHHQQEHHQQEHHQQEHQHHQEPPQSSADLLSSLTGGVDPKLLMRLLPLVQELGGQRDSNARALLYALRPYLKPERQEKVERALQLARLFHIGKKFLSGWEGL